MEVVKLNKLYEFAEFMSPHLQVSADELLPLCREFIIHPKYNVFRSSKNDAYMLIEGKGTKVCLIHLYTNTGADRGTLGFIDEVRQYIRMNTQYKIALNEVNVDDRQKRLGIRMLMKERGGKPIGEYNGKLLFKTTI